MRQREPNESAVELAPRLRFAPSNSPRGADGSGANETRETRTRELGSELRDQNGPNSLPEPSARTPRVDEACVEFADCSRGARRRRRVLCSHKNLWRALFIR